MDNDRYKFRVWNKKEKKMESLESIKFLGMMIVNGLPPYEYELLQSTGLHDKNGKEIFIHDYIKARTNYHSNDKPHDPPILEILFDGYRLIAKSPKGDVYPIYEEVEEETMEVIGNKFEHAYLLNETK